MKEEFVGVVTNIEKVNDEVIVHFIDQMAIRRKESLDVEYFKHTGFKVGEVFKVNPCGRTTKKYNHPCNEEKIMVLYALLVYKLGLNKDSYAIDSGVLNLVKQLNSFTEQEQILWINSFLIADKFLW